jgi:hypothetical protein
MTCLEKATGKLLIGVSQRDHGGAQALIGTRQLTRRLCLQTRICRPRTTTRFERGDRENAQTTRVRSEPHRTARIDSLIFFSLAPPHPLSAVWKPLQNQETVAG